MFVTLFKVSILRLLCKKDFCHTALYLEKIFGWIVPVPHRPR